MKARYIAYTIICLILSGCHNDREESHFTITGEIKNVEDNYMVILVKSAPGESSAEMIAIDHYRPGNGAFYLSRERLSGRTVGRRAVDRLRELSHLPLRL